MKREDLRSRLKAAGIEEEKLGEVVDYIMASNGADVQSLKDELEKTKASSTEATSKHEEEVKTLKTQLAGYKDYEDLKKFKEETLEKAENSKKSEFLKGVGCKHPDLMMSKLDFSKATYDEEKKTYTGLDDDVKTLKVSYSDLFEEQAADRVDPVEHQAEGLGSDFEAYKKAHPNWKFD